MPVLEIKSELDAEPDQIKADIFSMQGVNYELLPLVKMTVPRAWRKAPVNDWPRNVRIFTSVILLFGLLPADLHVFRLKDAWDNGFEEESKSLMNRKWNHRRTIERQGAGCVITDKVEFLPRLGIMGVVTKPIYAAVFRHRHGRLRARYAARS